MTAFDPLLDGYRRFREHEWIEQRERWASLADGQSPKVLIIACSDSRVDPARIFDVVPGSIFVVRNVAALVPPFEDDDGHHGTSAAIEFAVTQLKVEEVVVMGHESCGGCKAALQGLFAEASAGEGGFVRDWVNLLASAREKVLAEHGDGPEASAAMEHEGVRTSLANLRTFPFVEEAEKDGSLTLRGAWFAIRDGKLRLLDEASGTFREA